MAKPVKGAKKDKASKRDYKQAPKKEGKAISKKDSNREVIYGKNTVNEVLESKRKVFEVIVTDAVAQHDAGLMELVDKQNISCKVLPKQKFEQMAKDKYDVKGNHQGVLAIVEPYAYMPLNDLIKKATQKEEPAFILILDGLEDPHNLGAILRTADASGVDGIIIRKDRSVGLTSTVAKLSTGAIEHVPVACVANLTVAINQLKEAGLWIAGTDASEAQDYRTLDASLPLGLVIGSEGKGMSRLVREACDFKVYLPMRGHVTSLNASVAAALLMYEIYNKRNPIK